MRKIIIFILSIFLLLQLNCLSCIIVSAAESINGTYGDEISWELDKSGNLTITGSGDMSWLSSNDVPWKPNVSSIKKVIINNGITNIGVSAFSGCSNLTNITIPESVSKIERWAFSGCKNISNIVLPDTLVSIGDNAFRGCDSLKNINLTNSITNIGEYAFFGCESITSITIPSSLSCIENNTFMSCSGLTTIIIPNGVTRIEEHAFYFCENLVSIIVSDSVSYIGVEAFHYTEWYSDQPYGLVYLGDFLYTYKGAHSMEYNASITLKTGTKGIVDRAFSSCHNLKSLNIPDSVISIGEDVFRYCERLTNIVVDKNNNHYADIDGVLYTKNKERLILYPPNKEYTSFVIPSSVVIIEKKAFRGCVNLNKIIIPNGVTDINESSFGGCTNIDNIIFPDSLRSIGEYAFSGCSNLSSITLSNSVVNINATAFGNCKNLQDVFYKGTAEEWNEISIGEDNLYLTNANIHFNYSIQARIESFTAIDNGKTAIINISISNPPEQAVVYVASYDDFDRMLEIQQLTLVNGTGSGTFLTSKVSRYKAFVWGSNLMPFTEAKECQL